MDITLIVSSAFSSVCRVAIARGSTVLTELALYLPGVIYDNCTRIGRQTSRSELTNRRGYFSLNIISRVGIRDDIVVVYFVKWRCLFFHYFRMRQFSYFKSVEKKVKSKMGNEILISWMWDVFVYVPLPWKLEGQPEYRLSVSQVELEASFGRRDGDVDSKETRRRPRLQARIGRSTRLCLHPSFPQFLLRWPLTA